ncbi:FAD-dependent oxidoreductase [Rhizorhabdus histidinilytica]|uniref:FAD-dependent oxidoreductase n=1 Tax=Rhizorhabdus histidinilytica TaxID=439228 RepID=UPI00321FB592
MSNVEAVAGRLPSRTEVLIVGAGPVGLTLSLELSRYGIDHVLVSDGDGPSTHPKCNTTNARSMEHFRRLGLSRALRFGGLAENYPTDIVYLTRLGGEEIGRIRFPTARQAAEHDGRKSGPWLTPELQHRISQIFLERILLDDARGRPRAGIFLQRRLLDYRDDGTGVDAVIEPVEGGEPQVVRSRWIIGCDGARSAVRRVAGIAYEGESGADRPMFGGTMVATYYRSRRLAELFAGREGFMYWTVNPDIRSVTVAIDGKDSFLTHIQVPAEASPEAMDPRDFLRRVAGEDIDVEIMSSAVWNAGLRLVARQLIKGRAVLAGDAAHLFTPTGGFGMNTGIDDVANLAWKLAADVQGWGGPALVASYDAERRPIAHRNTLAASEVADILGAFPVPDAIEGAGVAGEQARELVRDAIAHVAVEEFGTVGVQLGARYEGSPIVVADGTPPPADSRTRYVPTARPGSRLPHFLLDGGVPIFDRLGIGLTLLDFSDGGADPRPLLETARARGIDVAHVVIASVERPASIGADIVMVRPDGHVAWRGDRLPDDSDAFFDRILGWLC